MKAIRVLVIIVFTIIIVNSPCWSRSSECDKIEAKIETEKTVSGQANGKVKVNLLKGDRSSAKYIFCKAEGEVLNENHFDKDSLDGLPKGDYICIISTSECTKKISFTIE
jgi:hypothetical protein